MRFIALFFILIGYTSGAAAAGPVSHDVLGDCRAELLSGQPPKLGIGMLVESAGGSRILGLSPYAGSLHSAIATKLSDTTDIKAVLWMGELRYYIFRGLPLVAEANETSGYYSAIQSVGFEHRGRSVPVFNSFANISEVNRAPDFRGHVFEPGNMRLARELQEIKGNIRHTIGNSLQVIFSVTRLVSTSRMTDQQKSEVAIFLREKHASDLALLRWLVEDLLEDGRVDRGERELMINLLTIYEGPQPAIQEIAATDLSALDRLMQKLSRLINRHSGQMRVEIYELR